MMKKAINKFVTIGRTVPRAKNTLISGLVLTKSIKQRVNHGSSISLDVE